MTFALKLKYSNSFVNCYILSYLLFYDICRSTSKCVFILVRWFSKLSRQAEIRTKCVECIKENETVALFPTIRDASPILSPAIVYLIFATLCYLFTFVKLWFVLLIIILPYITLASLYVVCVLCVKKNITVFSTFPF